MISELRPYQTECIDNIRQSIRGGVRRLVVQAATGAGKTKIAAAIVDGALSKGNRMAFVVPAIALIDQTVESFWAEGIRDIGVIQASHSMTDWSKPVQICSIQTLRARAAWPEAKTVIFDEVHVQPNRDLWDAMVLGMGTRRKPMIIGITTAGFDKTTLARLQGGCHPVNPMSSRFQSGTRPWLRASAKRICPRWVM